MSQSSLRIRISRSEAGLKLGTTLSSSTGERLQLAANDVITRGCAISEKLQPEFNGSRGSAPQKSIHGFENDVMKVPEPHVGRAALNFIAVSLLSRALHPVGGSHFPDWLTIHQNSTILRGRWAWYSLFYNFLFCFYFIDFFFLLSVIGICRVKNYTTVYSI